MEWKYQIGDHLKVKGEKMRRIRINGRDEISQPNSLVVRERITIECHGGTQYFYRCQIALGNQRVDMPEYEVEPYDVGKDFDEFNKEGGAL